MLGFGVAIGLGMSIALNGVVASWVKGSSRDPLTLLVSAMLLLFVAIAACVVPAWRAATIDPMRALRTE
jgi:ABC-type antimicrobial peptide transport system permease subunit